MLIILEESSINQLNHITVSKQKVAIYQYTKIVYRYICMSLTYSLASCLYKAISVIAV